jgi:hypothetical protein
VTVLKRALGLVLLGAGTVLLAHVPARATSSITDLLDWYDQSQYDNVLADLARRDTQLAHDSKLQGFIDPLPSDLDGAARRWISAGGPELAERRRLVAATLAIEISHSRKSVYLPFRAPLVIWGCELLRKNPPPVATDAERLWYIASVAALEEFSGWSLLVLPPAPSGAGAGRGASPPTGKIGDLQIQEGPSGHLAHARARFPNEPRFLLAQVEQSDMQTMGLGALRRDVESHYELRSSEIPPEVVADLRRRAADVNNERDRQDAAEALRRIESLPQIANGYAQLARYDSIHAEVELRFGYLAARTLNWDRAIEHLAMVPQVTSDSHLIYLSHYIRGWALQRSGKRAEATEAYRQALAIVPNVRSATTLLAAQLFLSDTPGDRGQAYGLLDASDKSNPPADPWMLYYQGDARLWPEFIARLREALK